MKRGGQFGRPASFGKVTICYDSGKMEGAFWTKGHYVNTAGGNEARMKKHIQ